MAFRITTFPMLALIATGRPGGEEVVNIGIKPTAMLVLLVAAGRHGISRRHIRDLLWEGASDANASNSLRQSVFRVRRAIGADGLTDVGGRLFLNAPMTVDIFETEQRIDSGRVGEAFELSSGPFGATLDVAGTALQFWIRDLRARVERRLLDALNREWAEAVRGPAPGLFAPLLGRARQVLGDVPELLWLQLEVAATLADGGTFEQVAGRLAALSARAHGHGRDEVATRTQTLRLRLQARIGGDRPIGVPIHADALGALEDAWRRAREGRSSVVCLIGESGTGRSWLLREVTRRCLSEGGRTVPLVALASSAGVPSASLRDLTVALTGYRGAAGVHPDFSDTIGRLHEGVLAPPSDAVPAVHDLLTAVAVEGPLLVTLDDAHHYDVRVLARLLRRLREAPVPGLLVVPVLQTGAGVDETPSIAIGRAEPEGIRTLLSAMARLPRAEWVTPVVESLHRASGGRPGRAAQLVVRLHRAGHLRVVDDCWNLTSTLSETLSALALSAA